LICNTSGIVEVVSVDGADLATVKTVQINLVAPDVKAIIINVLGNYSALQMAGMQQLASFNSKILWNFCQATSLKISCIDIAGSVLAPYADTFGASGVIYGKLIVGNFSGNLQQNLPCRGFVTPPTNNSICPIFSGDCSFNGTSPVEICLFNNGSDFGPASICSDVTSANQYVTLDLASCGVCPSTPAPTPAPTPAQITNSNSLTNGDRTETDASATGENDLTSSQIAERDTKYIILGVSASLLAIVSIVTAVIIGRRLIAKRSHSNYQPIKDDH